MNGGKCCRVWIKDGQVEISEDDYRLIMSGAPERMIPSQPIAEDESAELGTLNILESRLAVLIKRADTVASKARQLNYHLKGRKTAIMARKATDQHGNGPPEPQTFSHQPFQAINTRMTQVNGEAAKLQQDLLEQFESGDRRHSFSQASRPKASRPTTAESPNCYQNSNGEVDMRRSFHHSEDDTVESQNRALMATKIEKLGRGDVITPPCDRCRRLKFECTKHLTACQACTKKHAKCSWKDLKGGELDLAQVQHPLEGENRMWTPNGELQLSEHQQVVENTLAMGPEGMAAAAALEKDHAQLARMASAAAAATEAQ